MLKKIHKTMMRDYLSESNKGFVLGMEFILEELNNLLEDRKQVSPGTVMEQVKKEVGIEELEAAVQKLEKLKDNTCMDLIKNSFTLEPEPEKSDFEVGERVMLMPSGTVVLAAERTGVAAPQPDYATVLDTRSANHHYILLKTDSGVEVKAPAMYVKKIENPA